MPALLGAFAGAFLVAAGWKAMAMVFAPKAASGAEAREPKKTLAA